MTTTTGSWNISVIEIKSKVQMENYIESNLDIIQDHALRVYLGVIKILGVVYEYHHVA